ncbi:hypothetical protein SARC_14390, partial [Sphaeroforma arctica JP610]
AIPRGHTGAVSKCHYGNRCFMNMMDDDTCYGLHVAMNDNNDIHSTHITSEDPGSYPSAQRQS